MRSKKLHEDLYGSLKRHWGAIGEAADRAGVHRNTMMRVLKGQWNNPQLLMVAATVLKEREVMSKECLAKAQAMYSEAMTM
jgi:hypothetical protein